MDHCNCPWRCSSLPSVGVVIPLPVIYRWWLFRLGAIYCTASKILSWYIPKTMKIRKETNLLTWRYSTDSTGIRRRFSITTSIYQYMTWPVPGSWENGMNFKQPTMSCQRPFGSRNRTNCRSIKAWKSLAVQTWTDLKDIESPYCSFPARVTILLRANVQSTGLFRRRHLIPKFLSNLSTASGYPKLSGDDPTNLLKHFEALY